jgi:hypothetical protein
LSRHCCEDLREQVERTCHMHQDRADCPDCLIGYSADNDCYGILVHDGGSSMIAIDFCPWCGSKLEQAA